jgi:hypothetical protein
VASGRATTGIVDDDGQAQLVSMWVDPELRGRRRRESLVNAVLQGAVDGSSNLRMRLWVRHLNAA